MILSDELTTIGFPIVHEPLTLKKTIRHICSIEYVHCLLGLIYIMYQVEEETRDETQSKN